MQGRWQGREAAVLAVRRVFFDFIIEGILQVDACEAFNSLNRQTALQDICATCPAFAAILVIVKLFIDGETLFS